MPTKKRRRSSRPRQPAGDRRWLLLPAILVVMVSGWAITRTAGQSSGEIAYEVVARHPHDPDAYTQGLYFEDGFLIEGTGLRGRSSLRRVEIASGDILEQTVLPSRFFGEGVAPWENRIFQLTWQSGVGFIYEEDTFEQTGQFRYPGEGWGLTSDGEHLIMSDGTSALRFLDPESLEEVRRIEVTGPDGPVTALNELEFIEGAVYANVWYSNRILRIDPEDGSVTGEMDLTPLYLEIRPSTSDAVLNGIAYDPETGAVYVTGKLWPTLFELRVPSIR